MHMPDHPTWTSTDTPLGDLVIVAGPRGVTATEFHSGSSFDQLDRPRGQHFLPETIPSVPGQQPEHDPEALSWLTEQVQEWFSAARQDFDVVVDLSGIGGFRLEAYRVIQEIPFGQTASYGEVAAWAGAPRAARAVGTACRDVPVSLFLPVHRVTRVDGTTGESPNSACHRRELLRHEQAVLGRGPSPWN